MKPNILIVDDEPIACGVLERYINIKFPQCSSLICHSAIDAFKIIASQPIDIMLLDINMKGMTGVELLKSLRTPPLTIFTTAYSEYAVDGFNLNAVDYLLKPIAIDRFETAINKALNLLAFNNIASDNTSLIEDVSKHFFVRSNKSWLKIEIEKLKLISGMKDYLSLHIEDKKIVVYSTLSNFEEKLRPYGNFIRVHKSYIVNKEYITKVTTDVIYLNGIEVKIGKSYIRTINQLL